MRVRIIDKNHPYSGEIGELVSKQTVNGRRLEVLFDDPKTEQDKCFVQKYQVKIIK